MNKWSQDQCIHAEIARMDVDTLNLFVDAARAGSFAETARRSGIDPSLVSRRISGLEKTLGFRLFQRTTRTISLTEAGAQFLARVEPHLGAIEDARQASRDLIEQPTGLLRVTASSAFGYEILAPLVAGFTEMAPDVQLELLLTDRRINLVEEGVDLGVRLGALSDSDLIAKRIMAIQFRMYANPACAAELRQAGTPAILNETDCLTYPVNQYRNQVQAIGADGDETQLNLKGAISITSALCLKRCALEGNRPAFLPDWLVRGELASGALVDVFPDYAYQIEVSGLAAWFVYPSRLYVPLKVRRFMAFVTDAMQAQAGDTR